MKITGCPPDYRDCINDLVRRPGEVFTGEEVMAECVKQGYRVTWDSVYNYLRRHYACAILHNRRYFSSDANIREFVRQNPSRCHLRSNQPGRPK